MDSPLEKEIADFVQDQVKAAPTKTCYREPLVGFASVQDSLFESLKEIIGPHHLLPRDLLPEAQTVVVYFLPFTQELIVESRKWAYLEPQWSLAYNETNQLLETLGTKLKKYLEQKGITATEIKPTGNFDPVDLTDPWSHSSMGYIAGLGTFGLHQMLITRAGVAGRLGSIVISAEIPPTPRPEQEYCHYFRTGKCVYCVRHCPVGALTEEGLNKFRCWGHQQNKRDPDKEKGCGKCALGPCAIIDDIEKYLK